jgi:protein-disulfide isomerase
MGTASRIARLAALAALAAGCRTPAAPTDYDPDAGEFDASINDDAGLGPLCPEGSPDPFNNAYSPYEGGEQSVDLVVNEVAFAYCDHCAEFAVMWNEMFARRDDVRARVRVYYHHFPLNGPEIYWQAHAAMVAVSKQGNAPFWQLYDALYQKLYDEEIGMSPESIRAFADEELHLDMAQYDADYADPETMAFVEWDKAQGEAADVGGTPSIFVCGEKISWSHIEEVIDEYMYP